MNKYRDLNLYSELHISKPRYGASGRTHTDKVYDVIQKFKPNSILDFGCGKGTLKRELELKGVVVDNYDPAIPEWSTIPQSSYEMVVTTDVLEHLYPDEISLVFEEIYKLSPSVVYNIICTRIAKQILPDGSNAHKTVEDKDWWDNKIKLFFSEYEVSTYNRGSLTYSLAIKK